jgi:hypothetical protein
MRGIASRDPCSVDLIEIIDTIETMISTSASTPTAARRENSSFLFSAKAREPSYTPLG